MRTDDSASGGQLRALAAVVDGAIVGSCSLGASRDADTPAAGEIYALRRSVALVIGRARDITILATALVPGVR